MTERTPDLYTVQRAEEARQVLTNPAYMDAMKDMHTQINQQWLDCPIRDTQGQLLLLQLAKLARKFEDTLHGMVEAGKLAQHRINIDAERNESGARKLVRRIL